MGTTPNQQRVEQLRQLLRDQKVFIALETNLLARCRSSAMAQQTQDAIAGAIRAVKGLMADVEQEIQRLGADSRIDELELAKRIDREWRAEREAEEDEWSPAAVRRRRAASIEAVRSLIGDNPVAREAHDVLLRAGASEDEATGEIARVMLGCMWEAANRGSESPLANLEATLRRVAAGERASDIWPGEDESSDGGG